LAELFVYGLVVHFENPNNKGGGYWAVADGLDLDDCEALYKQAVDNARRLKTINQSAFVLPSPKNKRVLTE
jgi:hypothetical protein